MISSDVIRGEKETSDPLNPDDVLFIQRTERSKRESQSERAGSERVASLMSSAVCSIPLISPTGMPLLLHVTDQLPLHSSRLNLRARGCVPAWISAKARQASRGHASIELMSQRSEGNVVETYGDSIPVDGCCWSHRVLDWWLFDVKRLLWFLSVRVGATAWSYRWCDVTDKGLKLDFFFFF